MAIVVQFYNFSQSMWFALIFVFSIISSIDFNLLYLNYVKLLPNFEKTVLVCLENDFLFCFLNVSYLFSVFIYGCVRIDIMIKVKIFQICLFLVHENCFEQTAHAIGIAANLWVRQILSNTPSFITFHSGIIVKLLTTCFNDRFWFIDSMIDWQWGWLHG